MLRPLSVLGYLVMVSGIAGQIVTKTLLSRSVTVIAVQAGAVLLLVWARATFGRRSFHAAANPTAGGLVTAGPYRFIRHPIYTAACAFCGAGAIAHGSWLGGLFSGLVLAGALLRLFCEEALLTARYPEYKQYAATTWRMIPYVF